MKNKKEMEDNEHGMRETAGGMRERAFREEGERARNPAEQGTVKSANRLSVQVGENEDYAQNDLFYPHPGTRHAVGGGWVSGMPL